MSHVVVLHIRNNSDNLEVTRALHSRDSEVDSNRIVALGEHLLDEGLIDHGNRKRCRRVLRRNSTPLKNMMSNDVEELRSNAEPGSADMIIRPRFRPPLNVDALTPVVSLQRCVQRQSDPLDSRQTSKPLIDPLIERLQLLRFVTSILRTDMSDDPILRLHSKVLFLQLIQALCHQSRATQQHQRQRRSQYYQPPLQRAGMIHCLSV